MQPRDRPEKPKGQPSRQPPRGGNQQPPRGNNQHKQSKSPSVHWAERSDIDKTAKLRQSNNTGNGRPAGRNGDNRRPTLTKAQKDEYRAQGKCFTCGETTHMSKDCPQNNSLRPKNGVGSASVSFAEVERLRNLRDAESLGLFSLKFEQPKLSSEYLSAIDEVLIHRMRADLRMAVPFVWDCLHDPCEKSGERALDPDRFTIVPIHSGWMISREGDCKG
ncbi:hypothetical protein C8R45DRAFT_939465 [Mycena sanguinolenta]|nr:hypothetical protein C8R45DRAFT_939465 [Mycena sanguinolenta]